MSVARAASLRRKEIVVPTGAFEIFARALPRRHFLAETLIPEIDGGVLSAADDFWPTWIVTLAGSALEVPSVPV